MGVTRGDLSPPGHGRRDLPGLSSGLLQHVRQRLLDDPLDHWSLVNEIDSPCVLGDLMCEPGSPTATHMLCRHQGLLPVPDTAKSAEKFQDDGTGPSATAVGPDHARILAQTSAACTLPGHQIDKLWTPEEED